ncbi:MAG: radical SAM protein [Bryobacteraceae bacterium]|nr:radical SAM protein [Bryobacteraceae bacterium]
MGRQPFGLASPAAWLRNRGHEVTCTDLSLDPLPVVEIRGASLVGLYLPMHTATRLAGPVIESVRALNPAARICAYGLYAPLASDYLRSLGVSTVIGGEFEAELVKIAEDFHAEPFESLTSLEKLAFVVPDRAGLPIPERYPKLVVSGGKLRVGYTEASRGCKHRCRHCPVVPVYNGAFRIVQSDIVMEDIRRQVAAGAEHISFGDPDFLNGPTHARRIVEALHREFPQVSYDATIKIEHLLHHRDLLPVLRDTGCRFVISAVESVDDGVLVALEKGHTYDDFVRVAELFRNTGLTLSPTFIPFTPWTSLPGYKNLLKTIHDLDLVENVAPVQLTLRLLIPSGSRMLELSAIRSTTTHFDPSALMWKWKHPESSVDELAVESLRVVKEGIRTGASRREIFRTLWQLVEATPLPETFDLIPRATIPFLEEPWFC